MGIAVPIAIAVAGWYLTTINTSIAALTTAQAQMVTVAQFNDAVTELTKLNASIDKRTTTLETSTSLGRNDRIDFQKEQTAATTKILEQISLVLQGQATTQAQMSAVIQRLDANDKRLDTFETRLNNLGKGL